ncbi:hypothetical protein ACFL39_00505 [Gemmatimonadota bacterium]
MDPTLQIIITGLVTLAAAFLGAWYAFRLTDNARKRQLLTDQVSAINRALFVLGSHLNTLLGIRQQLIDPIRDDENKFMSMRPAQQFGEDALRVDLSSLEFLIETDHRTILMQLHIQQERFDTTIQALNERSRLHLEVLQPKMAELGIAEFTEYPRNELLTALGEPLVLYMQRATDIAITSVDITLETHTDLMNSLHSAMQIHFPDSTIIIVVPEPI